MRFSLKMPLSRCLGEHYRIYFTTLFHQYDLWYEWRTQSQGDDSFRCDNGGPAVERLLHVGGILS